MGRPRKNYRKVDLENLDETIQQELYAYKDEVRENMISIIKNLSKEAKSKLKSDSPESTGEYKEKWATRLETYPGQPARLTLYNKNIESHIYLSMVMLRKMADVYKQNLIFKKFKTG